MLTGLAITLAGIGFLLALLVFYAACVVSGEMAEEERERYRQEHGKEPPF